MLNYGVKMKFNDFGLKRFFNQYGGRLFLYFLVIYTFFMLGRSVLTNYQLQKQVKGIESSIVDIKNQNKDLENLVLYYQSDSFREVEARRKLGYKKPGEKIFTVSVQKFTDLNTEMESKTESLSTKEQEKKYSNLSLWWQYIFK